MKIDNSESRAFLFELYTMTNGDTESQVSMHDVGERLGLEKTQAGTMAENLFIQGLAELKTLSGGIGITNQGLEALDIKIQPKAGDEFLDLGTGPALEEKNIEAVEKIMTAIKDAIASSTIQYNAIEEMVIDIKTLDVQMLSQEPKTNIVREILRSIHFHISEHGPEDLSVKLETMINS